MNWDQCSERMPGNILQQREACQKQFKAQEWNTQRLRLKTDLWNEKFDVKMATAQSHGNQISMENWSSPFWSPSLLGISMWFSSFCSFFPKSDVTPEAEKHYSLNWCHISCFGIQWSCGFNLCIWKKVKKWTRMLFWTPAKHINLAYLHLLLLDIYRLRLLYYITFQESPYKGYPPFLAPCWDILSPTYQSWDQKMFPNHCQC